jgi:hypothetical protein
MPATLYRKTAAGQAEVGSKAHALPPRARSLLIMVDGKRSHDDLRAMLGAAVDEAIELLLREGLVERLAAPAAPAPAPAAAPVVAEAAMPDLDRLRREAAHAVTDALGPMADALALRIERAKDPELLRTALKLAAEALDNVGPRARAEAFRSRFLNF